MCKFKFSFFTITTSTSQPAACMAHLPGGPQERLYQLVEEQHPEAPRADRERSGAREGSAAQVLLLGAGECGWSASLESAVSTT